MKLKEIYKPIEKELERVEARLRDALNNRDKFVSTISEYALNAPGKRLRPALVLLSSKVGNPNLKQVIDLAASIELIHTATLIHDDVIDDAKIRRKQPALNVKFSKDTAILFGDYLYSKAFEIISVLNIPRITSILLQTTNVICRGELQQLRRIFRPISEKEYFKIISDKTASLFSACCETGGILAGAKKRQIQALKEYGHSLGMSFQITDDCLDLVGNEKKIGKTLKLDARCGKMTLPLIYLNRSPKKSTDEAIACALEISKNYGRQALRTIKDFEENEIKQSFKNLIEYILNRVN